MTQILIFGDSITYGAFDKKGGWVERLKEKLMGKDILVYNLGVSGDTTIDLLDRFENETRARYDNDTTLILEIGINDSYHSDITPEMFENNIQELIKKAKKYSKKIVFLGLTPVDESKTNPLPWNKNAFYKNNKIQKYDNIIKEVCKRNSIHFIEISNNFAKTDYKILLHDGLHPNTKGHEKIFEIVSKDLNKLIGQDLFQP